MKQTQIKTFKMYFLLILCTYLHSKSFDDFPLNNISPPTSLKPISLEKLDTLKSIYNWQNLMVYADSSLIYRSLKNNYFHKGINPNPYFLVFQTQTQMGDANFILEIKTNRLPFLKVYKWSENKWFALDENHQLNYFPTFELESTSGISSYGILLQQPNGVLRLPMALTTLRHSNFEKNLLTLTIGLLAGISLFSLFILLFTHLKYPRSEFIWYALYIFSNILWILFDTGIGNYFFNLPQFWNNGQVQKSCAVLCILSITKFLNLQFPLANSKANLFYKFLFIGYSLSGIIYFLEILNTEFTSNLNLALSKISLFTLSSVALILFTIINTLIHIIKHKIFVFWIGILQIPAIITIIYSLLGTSGKIHSNSSYSQLIIYVLLWEGFCISAFLTDKVLKLFNTNRQMKRELNRNIQEFSITLKCELESLRDDLQANIHDEVQQWVTSLGLLIYQTRANISEEQYAIIKTALEGLNRSIRNSLEIVGNVDLNFSLILFIKEIVNLFNNGSEIKINFEHSFIDSDYYIQNELKKIFLEILNNSIKHSKPNEIDIKIFQKQGKLVLEFNDDGLGFNPHKANDVSSNNKFGLKNISLRCLKINATYKVTSQYGSYGNKHTLTI